MLHRTRCPVCESAPCASGLRLPYGSGVLAGFVQACPVGSLLAGEFYHILHCPRCGLRFQELVPGMAEAAVLYAGGAELGAGKARPLPELAHLAEDAIHIRLLMPDRRPKVLDFGMNRGDWAAMSGAFGCEIWGTDIDDAAATAAKERGVRFVRFENLATADYDFINADQVFEHLTDPVSVLRVLEHSLRPGGWLKLSTPGDRRITAKLARARAGGYDEAEWRREFDSLAPLVHVNLFERRSLVALGMHAGLEPYRLPLRIAYAAMVLFHTRRQWNRNLVNPWKRWRGGGTWQYFKKPAKA